MTDDQLRDWFSGLAMQKILTVKPKHGGGIAVECNIQACYDIADAMVKERERRKTETQKEN